MTVCLGETRSGFPSYLRGAWAWGYKWESENHPLLRRNTPECLINAAHLLHAQLETLLTVCCDRVRVEIPTPQLDSAHRLRYLRATSAPLRLSSSLRDPPPQKLSPKFFAGTLRCQPRFSAPVSSPVAWCRWRIFFSTPHAYKRTGPSGSTSYNWLTTTPLIPRIRKLLQSCCWALNHILLRTSYTKAEWSLRKASLTFGED